MGTLSSHEDKRVGSAKILRHLFGLVLFDVVCQFSVRLALGALSRLRLVESLEG